MAVPDVHGRMVARLMTACGAVVEEVAFFSDSELGTHLAFFFCRMDNPDFWYECSVTCLSLGAYRIVSVWGLCGEEVATPTTCLMWFRMVVLIGLDRWPRAIDSLVFLMKNFPCSRPMDRVVFRSSVFWMRRDTRDPAQYDHVEMRSESGQFQLESPADADTPCVSADRLDHVFGRIMVSSLVSHVVVGQGLSRNVASTQCFPFPVVGDCTETCMGLMVLEWPVRFVLLTAVPLSTSCPRNSETYKAEIQTHVADTSRSQVTSCWSASFLVVQVVTVTKLMTKRRKAGEVRCPSQ